MLAACRPQGRHDSFQRPAHISVAPRCVALRQKRTGPVVSHLLPTYARVDLAFERGEGAWLTATNGERYLDFTSGIAVNALGHAHPHLIEALTTQAAKLWHVSNLYRIPEGERLAERLCDATFADKVFFTNSGAEALECAIKMARKYQSVSGHPERFRILTVEGAFHGRTLATLAAGGQQKYLEGFGPKAEGFDQVPYGDHEALKAAITPETAAIMVEPIQAEGGVRAIPPQCLRGLRQLLAFRDAEQVGHVPDLAGLRLQRLDEMRVRVPEGVHGDAGPEIEIALASIREEPGPLSSLEGEVRAREGRKQRRRLEALFGHDGSSFLDRGPKKEVPPDRGGTRKLWGRPAFVSTKSGRRGGHNDPTP
jgi:hypothetical protein